MARSIQGLSHLTRRNTENVERTLRARRTKKQTTAPLSKDTVRIIPLGGQDGIGEKNMIVVEYNDTAIILDCGFELGVDLPGINYAIPAVEYLETIRHKIKAYIISHGHLDHIGGLIHILPDFPAPVYGSRFTIGMVQAQFEKAAEHGTTFTPDTVVMDMDAHERLKIGDFVVELIRVTHAIPESSAIVVDTPIGRIINTGDFRLDPEPLDQRPTDIARLKALGDEGVAILMSESTNTTKLGRTPTEHTLQDSFSTLIHQVPGRAIIAVFSSNMNRIQMIINAAKAADKKVALDGRSMVAIAEMAFRMGALHIPKGLLIPIRDTTNLPDNKVVIVCTGGQGEPGAALSRMAAGEHQHIKLHEGDSVVVSSTPIPGNEQSYGQIGDLLAAKGVTLFRHPTHEIDGSGPLHVSGHAYRDEHAEMMQLTRPKFLMPIYGGALPRAYHRDIGIAQGMARNTILMADNGEVIEFSRTKKPRVVGKVTAGSRLVDQTGSVVSEIVTKDRMLLRDHGFIVVVVTVTSDGKVIGSPDVITRGHIAVKQNMSQLNGIRAVVRQTLAGNTRLKSRAAIDETKDRIRETVSDYTFQQTGHMPTVIPVVMLQ